MGWALLALGALGLAGFALVLNRYWLRLDDELDELDEQCAAELDAYADRSRLYQQAREEWGCRL